MRQAIVNHESTNLAVQNRRLWSESMQQLEDQTDQIITVSYPRVPSINTISILSDNLHQSENSDFMEQL